MVKTLPKSEHKFTFIHIKNKKVNVYPSVF